MGDVPTRSAGDAGAAPAKELRPFPRPEHMDQKFSLLRHLLGVGLVALIISVLGLWLARDARAVDWVWAPVFWVIANFFEWGIHKFPMHRPMFPRKMYSNHTLIHHRAFARADDMAIDDIRELSLVMMPWYTLVFVFLTASPVAVAAWFLGGETLSGVFLLSSVLYFLFYEVMHTVHHLPRRTVNASWFLGTRTMRRILAHHAHHHELRRMTDVNFNVTLPFADFVLGTNETPAGF